MAGSVGYNRGGGGRKNTAKSWENSWRVFQRRCVPQQRKLLGLRSMEAKLISEI